MKARVLKKRRSRELREARKRARRYRDMGLPFRSLYPTILIAGTWRPFPALDTEVIPMTGIPSYLELAGWFNKAIEYCS